MNKTPASEPPPAPQPEPLTESAEQLATNEDNLPVETKAPGTPNTTGPRQGN